MNDIAVLINDSSVSCVSSAVGELLLDPVVEPLVDSSPHLDVFSSNLTLNCCEEEHSCQPICATSLVPDDKRIPVEEMETQTPYGRALVPLVPNNPLMTVVPLEPWPTGWIVGNPVRGTILATLRESGRSLPAP